METKYSLSAETSFGSGVAEKTGMCLVSVRVVHSLGAEAGRGPDGIAPPSVSQALPFQTEAFLFTLRTDGNQTSGEGSVPCAPWGFCIPLSKKSSKSKEINEAADCSQLCRTCLTFTMLTD